MARVGIVGDIHLPFTHPMYLKFTQDIFDQWQVNKVHFVGDIVDSHAMSFWEHDPDGYSAGEEADAASKALEEWRAAYPVATVAIGNHDARHLRQAKKSGIPARFVKDYKAVWETPKWAWDFSHVIDGVLYEHGTGTSGKDAAINLAIQKRVSTTIGHTHTYAGVKWHSNLFGTVFGLNAGCGIDCRAYAFEYGRDFPVRPMLGCAVVIDGWNAFFEPMRCGEGEPYNRRKV